MWCSGTTRRWRVTWRTRRTSAARRSAGTRRRRLFAREGHLEPLGLQAGQEAGLLDRAHVGFVGVDELLLGEVEQGVVQRQHAEFLAGLNDRGDLECLPLAD